MGGVACHRQNGKKISFFNEISYSVPNPSENTKSHFLSLTDLAGNQHQLNFPQKALKEEVLHAIAENNKSVGAKYYHNCTVSRQIIIS